MIVRIGAQLIPLLEEQVLDEGEQSHVRSQLEPIVQARVLPVQANALVGPCVPCCHAEMPLNGHEQRIVIEPVDVLLRECLHVGKVALPSSVACETQQIEAVLVQEPVVDARGVFAPLPSLDLCLGEEAVGNEKVEVHEVWIARKRRWALVGRVPVACGANGKDLPPRLSRVCQEVHEALGRLAHGANAIWRWQREQG